jgi:hypothetical protein
MSPPFGEREIVRIDIHPALDAYLSGKKWKQSGAIFDVDKRNLPPWTKLMVRRIGRAVNFRIKDMARTLLSRRRLRGETKKEKIEELVKHVWIRSFVSKKAKFSGLIKWAQKRGDSSFLLDIEKASQKGVNPLFDAADILILANWDLFEAVFCSSLNFFIGFTYTEKRLPGLIEWRDGAAALFLAFVLGDESFYTENAKPTTQHPSRRRYHKYKKRRQLLDLRPSRPPVIINALWDQGRDVLYLASEPDGWGWEIDCFYPHARGLKEPMGSRHENLHEKETQRLISLEPQNKHCSAY